MAVSVQARYLAIAVLLGSYVVALPSAIQWSVPGGEQTIVWIGALLSAFAITALLALLSPKVRAVAMAERHRTMFYASALVIVLYLAWAGSLLLRPMSE
jgi:hypothetical protein